MQLKIEKIYYLFVFYFLVILFVYMFSSWADYTIRYFLSSIIFIFLLFFLRDKDFRTKLLSFLLYSAFLPKIFLCYLTAFILLLTLGIYSWKMKKFNVDENFIILSISITVWAIISWTFNNLYYEKDLYGIFFWGGTFLFPFFIYIFVYNFKESKIKDILEKIYLYLIFLEIIIIFVKAIVTKKFILEDGATGTCYNAHVLGVHIILGIFITLHNIFNSYKEKKIIKVQNIFYFLLLNIALIMTSTKAQTIIYFLIFLVTIFYKSIQIITKMKIRNIIGFVVIIIIFLGILFKFNYNYIQISHKRIKDAIKNINSLKNKDTLGHNKTSGKIFAYRLIFEKIWKDKDINFLFGTGPAKYTSKASKLRMPSIADNRIPFLKIKEKQWKIFNKYIYRNFYVGPKNFKEFSWGTFSSPMTSINSIIVELGLGGIVLFMGFISFLMMRIVNKLRKKRDNFYILSFFIFFVLNLFYLNYWEDPTLTVPIFVFLGIYI